MDWRLDNWFSLTIILNNITKDYSLVHCMYPQGYIQGFPIKGKKAIIPGLSGGLIIHFNCLGFMKKPIYTFEDYVPYKLWLLSKPWPLQRVHIHTSSNSLEIWLVMAIFGWTIKKNKNAVHKGR